MEMWRNRHSTGDGKRQTNSTGDGKRQTNSTGDGKRQTNSTGDGKRQTTGLGGETDFNGDGDETEIPMGISETPIGIVERQRLQ